MVPETDELVLGVLGSIGNRFAPAIVAQSDLIVIFGSGFRQRNLVPGVDVIQVDMDPVRVGKTFPVRVGIVGDAGVVVRNLLGVVEPGEMDPDFKADIAEAGEKRRNLLDADAASTDVPINPGAVIQALKRQAAPDAVICSDVGDHTYWFYKRFDCDRHTTLLCANMAGMGFGLPAAIASQFAEPDREVIAVTGDGGFGMLGMELSTAVHNELPINVIVFNDGKLKNIGKEQDQYGFPRYRIDFPNPGFAEMATSLGALGIRVTEPASLDDALREAMDSDKPALVEVMVNPDTYIKGIKQV
jgi:pyruvate oxidase